MNLSNCLKLSWRARKAFLKVKCKPLWSLLLVWKILIIVFLSETELDFESRVKDAASYIKDKIDIKVKSFKDAIDKKKVTLNEEIDAKVYELIK
jgi:hypothetical protein